MKLSDELRTLQLAELELFKIFAGLCEKYSITYFALGGTILGAVRHKGFIPWDDDMDVGIPRPDYDRFCRIMESCPLDENISFRTFHSDSTYLRYFAHLEDARVRVVRRDRLREETANAWIDIFPLDAMPDNSLARRIRELRVLACRAAYRFSSFDTMVNVDKPGRPLYERILISIGMHTPVQRCFDTRRCLCRLERVLTRTPYEASHYLVNAMGAYKFREMFHRIYYGEGKWYSFEDTRIRGPIDADTVCRQLYGDYMELPPEDERNSHGLSVIYIEE